MNQYQSNAYNVKELTYNVNECKFVLKISAQKLGVQNVPSA